MPLHLMFNVIVTWENILATGNSDMVCALSGLRNELCRILYDMACRYWENCKTDSMANVHLHLYRSEFSELCQHRRPRHMCEKLPKKSWNHVGPNEGFRGP